MCPRCGRPLTQVLRGSALIRTCACCGDDGYVPPDRYCTHVPRPESVTDGTATAVTL
jgi:ribosomal protein L37AE/L43A